MDDTSRRVTGADEFSGRAADDSYRSADGARSDTRDPMVELRNRAAEPDRASQDAPRSGSDDDDADRRAAQIRAEIADTRDEMTETIDALQERLRPRNIVANATDRIKQKTSETMHNVAESAGETAYYMGDRSRNVMGGVMDTIREHPISSALLGAGAAWWLVERSRAANRGDQYREYRDIWAADEDDRRYEGDRRYENDRRDETDRRYQSDRGSENGMLERIKNNPIPAALAGFGLTWLAVARGQRSGEARSYRSGVADEGRWVEYEEEGGMRERAREYAGETAARAKEYATATANTVRRGTRRAKSQMQRAMEQNPLLVGAGALLVGVAFGLAIPESERENEWMGEARDRVVDRAQDMARNAATQVQNVATEVRDAATGVLDAATKPDGGQS